MPVVMLPGSLIQSLVPIQTTAQPSPDADHLASVSRQTCSLVRNLERELCVPIQTPLLPRPKLRKSRTPAQTLTRKSIRIARQARETDTTKQAQKVLLKKLGMQVQSPQVGQDTAALCKQAFRGPLSDAAQDNLQLLLGAPFDPVAFNLDMLGLDEGASAGI